MSYTIESIDAQQNHATVTFKSEVYDIERTEVMGDLPLGNRDEIEKVLSERFFAWERLLHVNEETGVKPDPVEVDPAVQQLVGQEQQAVEQVESAEPLTPTEEV